MPVHFRTILACAAMVLSTVRPCMRAQAGADNPSFVCNTSMFPTNVREKVASRIRQAIGGGQVQDGPFTFCVFLYADPLVQPNASHPSLMISIPGVGWSALWVYHGANIRGNTIESYGLAPDQVTPKLEYTSFSVATGEVGSGVGCLSPGTRDRVIECGLAYRWTLLRERTERRLPSLQPERVYQISLLTPPISSSPSRTSAEASRQRMRIQPGT